MATLLTSTNYVEGTSVDVSTILSDITAKWQSGAINDPTGTKAAKPYRVTSDESGNTPLSGAVIMDRQQNVYIHWLILPVVVQADVNYRINSELSASGRTVTPSDYVWDFTAEDQYMEFFAQIMQYNDFDRYKRVYYDSANNYGFESYPYCVIANMDGSAQSKAVVGLTGRNGADFGVVDFADLYANAVRPNTSAQNIPEFRKVILTLDSDRTTQLTLYINKNASKNIYYFYAQYQYHGNDVSDAQLVIRKVYA